MKKAASLVLCRVAAVFAANLVFAFDSPDMDWYEAKDLGLEGQIRGGRIRLRARPNDARGRAQLARHDQARRDDVHGVLESRGEAEPGLGPRLVYRALEHHLALCPRRDAARTGRQKSAHHAKSLRHGVCRRQSADNGGRRGGEGDERTAVGRNTRSRPCRLARQVT